MSGVCSAVNPTEIARCEKLIRPYVRCTSVIEIAATDVGLQSCKLCLKLELLQHSGSFKARGAFANLLTRKVPAAGVVAASGGNPGGAVAYAAMTLGVPATIFVPSVSSPAKMQRIREYGAGLVIEGDRYADALAASEAWVQQSGAMPVHAFDQHETMLGQGTIGMEFDEQVPDIDTPGLGRGWRPDRRDRCVVCWAYQSRWRRAVCLADADEGLGSRTSRGRGSRRHRGGLPGAKPSGRANLPNRQDPCAWHRACGRRGDQTGPERPLAGIADRRRAWGSGRVVGNVVRGL